MIQADAVSTASFALSSITNLDPALAQVLMRPARDPQTKKEIESHVWSLRGLRKTQHMMADAALRVIIPRQTGPIRATFPVRDRALDVLLGELELVAEALDDTVGREELRTALEATARYLERELAA